ncbi:Oocyte zinc finger [Pelobates cultripes]|uniref:Oocyte zinc finger n=1 Tax=Pelobates cultripes TaxID=61616 RepID=A0AAD1T7S6_PELCU|nr:Oocyte zinc finger [Pelobates cultripes]
MRMNMDRNEMAERILDLTLEIIYLLTGEDCMVVNKLCQSVTQRNSAMVSSGSCSTDIASSVPPHHSQTYEGNTDQKILELTNQITQLLTGEVPIRCEDVAVYFSMEEWEYLEGHEHLYKDVMMENHQTLSSSDKSIPEEFHSHVTLSNSGTEDEVVNKMENGEKYLALAKSKKRLTHTRKQTFSCSKCGKVINQKRNLIRHQMMHTGEKPFTCPICEKSFTRKQNLIVHERKHTEKQAFLCSYCGKFFMTKSSLISHQMIHTGEIPSECPSNALNVGNVSA